MNERLIADLRTTPLSLEEALRAVSHDEAGGIATFVGTVRKENLGRAVSKLEYHAYEPMARQQMLDIAAQIELEIPDVRVCVVHRLGVLAIGDVAVVCAASAPHRDEAFRACRLLIDRVKASVPIWKREWCGVHSHWINWDDQPPATGGMTATTSP